MKSQIGVSSERKSAALAAAAAVEAVKHCARAAALPRRAVPEELAAHFFVRFGSFVLRTFVSYNRSFALAGSASLGSGLLRSCNVSLGRH